LKGDKSGELRRPAFKTLVAAIMKDLGDLEPPAERDLDMAFVIADSGARTHSHHERYHLHLCVNIPITCPRVFLPVPWADKSGLVDEAEFLKLYKLVRLGEVSGLGKRTLFGTQRRKFKKTLLAAEVKAAQSLTPPPSPGRAEPIHLPPIIPGTATGAPEPRGQHRAPKAKSEEDVILARPGCVVVRLFTLHGLGGEEAAGEGAAEGHWGGEEERYHALLAGRAFKHAFHMLLGELGDAEKAIRDAEASIHAVHAAAAKARDDATKAAQKAEAAAAKASSKAAKKGSKKGGKGAEAPPAEAHGVALDSIAVSASVEPRVTFTDDRGFGGIDEDPEDPEDPEDGDEPRGDVDGDELAGRSSEGDAPSSPASPASPTATNTAGAEALAASLSVAQSALAAARARAAAARTYLACHEPVLSGAVAGAVTEAVAGAVTGAEGEKTGRQPLPPGAPLGATAASPEGEHHLGDPGAGWTAWAADPEVWLTLARAYRRAGHAVRRHTVAATRRCCDVFIVARGAVVVS